MQKRNLYYIYNAFPVPGTLAPDIQVCAQLWCRSNYGGEKFVCIFCVENKFKLKIHLIISKYEGKSKIFLQLWLWPTTDSGCRPPRPSHRCTVSAMPWSPVHSLKSRDAATTAPLSDYDHCRRTPCGCNPPPLPDQWMAEHHFFYLYFYAPATKFCGWWWAWSGMHPKEIYLWFKTVTQGVVVHC